MKKLIGSILITLLLTANTLAGFEGKQDGDHVGVFGKINCSTGLTCTRTGRGDFTMTSNGTAGVLHTLIPASTGVTLTTAQCGSTVINSTGVLIALPAVASAINGCRFTFSNGATGAQANLDVNPNGVDYILAETNVAGDAIRNATVGNSITLEATILVTTGSGVWHPVATTGTWSDIN